MAEHNYLKSLTIGAGFQLILQGTFFSLSLAPQGTQHIAMHYPAHSSHAVWILGRGVTAIRADQRTGKGDSIFFPSILFHQAMSFFPLNLLEL